MTGALPQSGATGGAASVARHLRGLAALAERVAAELPEEVAAAAAMAAAALTGGGKLLFCGNGGSAADAQHLATEYVVRFRRDGGPLRALALTTDSSLLTAGANDLGFERVFARQVEALGLPGDVLFLHSTSGRSPNLLEATRAARRAGIRSVALVAGDGGELEGLADLSLRVPTSEPAHAQELQLAIGHAICDIVEGLLRTRPGRAAGLGEDGAWKTELDGEGSC